MAWYGWFRSYGRGPKGTGLGYAGQARSVRAWAGAVCSGLGRRGLFGPGPAGSFQSWAGAASGPNFSRTHATMSVVARPG